MVEHIAPALAVYAVPAPVVKHIVLAQAVSYAAPAEVLKHFEFAPAAYAAPTATATGRFGSFSDVPTVSTLTCGKVHRASTGSVCCTCACCGIHRACTSSVLDRASTGTGLLGASACSLCRTYCDCNICVRFSPCRAYFDTCTCGAIHHANTRSYAAPAPVMSTSRKHNSFLRRASSNTEYLAPAFVAYAATLATVTGGFGLSLSNPPFSVDHACRVLCIHVHSATVAVVLWLNFRLLICNVVHWPHQGACAGLHHSCPDACLLRHRPLCHG